VLANVRASAASAYQIPPKDAFKRSTWPTPAQLTYADEPNGFWFAVADECAPGIWSPGGHGRRFGVMLERALAALGVKPQTLEAALNRKANARKKPTATSRRTAGGRRRRRSITPAAGRVHQN
jgi:hypothetical protein